MTQKPPKLAIIGGSCLRTIAGLKITHREVMHTPYGSPSGLLVHGEFDGKSIVFLARHGYSHQIPPHKINYRANLWALNSLGVTRIFAAAAVGGLAENLPPETLAVPDQIIDYTWGRQQTFFEDNLAAVTHIDFSEPYDETLRKMILQAGQSAGIALIDGGTYGVTQGPRLETKAEIKRMINDGTDMVGMTAMPEAALAKELGIAYASCAISANWGAGLKTAEISIKDIMKHLAAGEEQLMQLLPDLIAVAA